MTAPSLTISTIENGTLALSPSESPVLIAGTDVRCQSLRAMTERPHQAPGWATREKLLACLLLSVAYVVAGRAGSCFQFGLDTRQRFFCPRVSPSPACT